MFSVGKRPFFEVWQVGPRPSILQLNTKWLTANKISVMEQLLYNRVSQPVGHGPQPHIIDIEYVLQDELFNRKCR